MAIDILCTPYFNAKDEHEMETAAKELNMTKEELIRAAVRFQVSQCVPTQKRHTKKVT